MKKWILGAAAACMAISAPVMTAPAAHAAAYKDGYHGKHKKNKRSKAYRKGYNQGRRDAEYVGNDTRIWRDRSDGRYYCKRNDGTTGLLIGGAAGGLAGNQIAGRGDKLLGTVIGAAGGALLGREIDRSNYRCR